MSAKVSCPVRIGGKAGDNFKGLPIDIIVAARGRALTDLC